MSRTQLVLCVHPGSPFKNAQELVAHANLGKLTFASAGIGTGIYLASEQFRQVTGIEIVVAPSRGGAPALADFLSGKVDFTFGAVPTIKPHIEGGKARGLGVTHGHAPQLTGTVKFGQLGRRDLTAVHHAAALHPPAALVLGQPPVTGRRTGEAHRRATIAGEPTLTPLDARLQQPHRARQALDAEQHATIPIGPQAIRRAEDDLLSIQCRRVHRVASARELQIPGEGLRLRQERVAFRQQALHRPQLVHLHRAATGERGGRDDAQPKSGG